MVKVFYEAQFSGTYSFKILDVPPPNQFAIIIDDTISIRVAAVTAVQIDAVAIEDDYEFTAPPGQRIFAFDSGSTDNRILWKLFDPAGRELFFDRLDGRSEERRVGKEGGS